MGDGVIRPKNTFLEGDGMARPTNGFTKKFIIFSYDLRWSQILYQIIENDEIWNFIGDNLFI